jgi:RNA polymerase sigma-70 factor (ECF subfamily)
MDGADQSRDAVAEISEGIRAGNKQAERELFVRFRQGIVLMLQRRLSDRWLAEDIANDALSEALRQLRTRALNEPDKLAAFLHGIAVNLARNANRKQARRRTDSDTETVETTEDTSRDPAILNMRASLAHVVREMLSTLPVARDREILVRFYLNEDEKADICRDLKLTAEHFDRVVHRARQRMRLHIEASQPQANVRDFLAVV